MFVAYIRNAELDDDQDLLEEIANYLSERGKSDID